MTSESGSPVSAELKACQTRMDADGHAKTRSYQMTFFGIRLSRFTNPVVGHIQSFSALGTSQLSSNEMAYSFIPLAKMSHEKRVRWRNLLRYEYFGNDVTGLLQKKLT